MTTVPFATFWPVAVATADASTRCVESGMSVIRRVVFVIVPSAFVCGHRQREADPERARVRHVSVAVFD